MIPPLLKLKCSVLLVNGFYHVMKALPYSSLAITHDALCHAHQLYRQQVSYKETEKQ